MHPKNKAERLYIDKKVINKRLKKIKDILGSDSEYLQKIKTEANRLNKQNPFDCGTPQCGLCHSDKIFQKGEHKKAYKNIRFEYTK